MTAALDALTTALGDVDNLIAHHPKAANPGPGRPASDEGPLMRSCMLLTYAAWEVFVEDGLIGAAEKLTSSCSSPQQLPAALRSFVATSVKEDPWKLAGDGWRKTTVKAVTTHVRGAEDNGPPFGFNTASPGQITVLHDLVLGIRPLNQCRWSNSPPATVKAGLARFIRIRGEIAHTGRCEGETLGLRAVHEWRDFIEQLAGHLDHHLDRWVSDHPRAEAGQ